MKTKWTISALVVVFLCGCAQTRVYKKDFSSVIRHMNKSFGTDLTKTKKCRLSPAVSPSSKVKAQEITPEDEAVAKLLGSIFSGHDLEMEEYIPNKKMRLRLTNRFLGVSRKVFTLEPYSDTESKLSVDFFSRFLIFFSPERSNERAFLDEFGHELDSGTVKKRYERLSGEEILKGLIPLFKPLEEIERNRKKRHNNAINADK